MSSDQKDNLFPIFGEILSREDKENLLGQKGTVLWLTGLSGSGKSTIAKHAERLLHQQGFAVKLLDGDNVRTKLNSDLGFSVEDRKENIRRVAEVSRLFLDAGFITICSFISPTEEIRKMCREIIGADDFKEVAIECSLAECEKRDVKGLYAKARAGEIQDFTGIHQEYESPAKPALVLNTETDTAENSAQRLTDFVLEMQPQD